MKFKKLFTLSASLTVALCTSLSFMIGGGTSVAKESDKTDKTIRFKLLPDLKFVTDTLYFTNENFNRSFPRVAAGQFVPGTNTVRVSYFVYNDSANARVRQNCDNANQAIPIVRRHEMEHARKANIVQNVSGLSGWDRARLAVMNEAMAPGGEIIEAIEYHIANGERYPQNRSFLWRADSLIMAQHEKNNPGFAAIMPVGFSDRVIADAVLESAIDKFAYDHKRGFYHKKIKDELRAVKRAKYKPHNQCDLRPNMANYVPALNQWGALWTYDVSIPWTPAGRGKVDIWNSASDAARRRTINKVDSIVKSDMAAGQMLMPKTFEYPD